MPCRDLEGSDSLARFTPCQSGLAALHSKALGSSLLHMVCTFPPASFLSKTGSVSSAPTLLNIAHGLFCKAWPTTLQREANQNEKNLCVGSNCTKPSCAPSKSASSQKHTTARPHGRGVLWRTGGVETKVFCSSPNKS